MDDHCPQCGTDHQYEDGNGIVYSRVVGHVVWGVYDGVLFWSCPACGFAWSRWPEGDYRYERATEHAARFNERGAEQA